MKGRKFAAIVVALIVAAWAGAAFADGTNPITITTSTLPTGRAGVSYDAVITASSDSEILAWTVNDLPESLDAIPSGKTCLITGIPSTAGTFTLTIKVADKDTLDAKKFTLTVKAQSSDEPVTITSDTVPDAGTGLEYSHTLTATGSPSEWSITSGDLPDGLTISADGKISGKVSDSAISRDSLSEKIYTFDVTASSDEKSDTKTFSITVYEPVRIATESLPGGKAGSEYSAVIEAHGTRRDFTQSILPPDDMPPGLEVNTSELGRIVITGSPSIEGTYSIRVSFANFWGNAEKLFTFTVEGNATPSVKPQITVPKGLASLTAGGTYRFKYTASGTETITWSATGNIPDGLTFDPASSTLSGTVEPQSEGKASDMPLTYDFAVTATNAGGSDTASSRVSVWYPPEIVTAPNLPEATVNNVYSATITAEGTGYSTVWKKLSGSLPKGLTMTMSDNTRTCTITGTPQSVGTFLIKLSAKNNAGSSEKQFTLRVNADTSTEQGKPSILTESLHDGDTGAEYLSLLEASGHRPITWTKSGIMPKGLKLDKYGTISGIPQKAGVYHFTVTAKNNAGSVKKNLTIRINGETYSKPKITTKAIPEATLNQSYSVQLECSGTSTDSCPMIWTFANTKYPAGLYITSSGMISGTPKEAGKFTVKVRAENNIGYTTKSYSLKVNGIAPSIITGDLPAGLKGTEYSSQLLADGTGPITWSKSSSFPSGLRLNSKTGAITGKPTKKGTYSFTVTAKSKHGKDTRTFAIIVSDSEASALPETVEDYTVPTTQDYGHEEFADIFVLSGDEELRGEIFAAEGKPLTVVIGTWPGGFEPDSEDVEVYIADEAIALEVDEDGTFTIPGELVYDEFVVYGVADGMRTEEIYVVAE